MLSNSTWSRCRRAGGAAALLGLVSLLPVMVAPAGAAAVAAAPSAVPITQSYGTDVTIQGHGFGHGEGMGQYGAYGYATTYRWSWQQILAHYYGGTTQAVTDPNQQLSVRLQAVDDRPFTAFVQDRGYLATNADGWANRYRSVAAVETATPGVFAVYARNDAMVCPTGPAFDATGWTLINGAATSSTTTGTYLDLSVPGVDPATPDATNLAGLCQPDGAVIYYRGLLRTLNGSVGENRTVNFVPLDLYVRGVVPREMPASWGTAAGNAGMNALRAQAVAARSFALAGGMRWPYAKVCDTQSCQVYGGVARRATTAAALTALEQPTATTATAETAGVILVRGGLTVSAMYSSSTGGITAGVVFPWVVDAGDDVSPHKNWSVTVPVATVEAKWPAVGRLVSIDVTRRNGLGEWGGRVLELAVRGSAGTVKLTGDQFRIGLGLKSNWFNVPDGCAGRTGGTAPAAPAAVAFNPVTPTRVVDTRSGLNAPFGRVTGGCVLPVRLAGLGGVPATGATAVVLNLTAVAPGGPGYATIYPCASGRPEVSTLNYNPGEVVPNLATVAIDGDGYVCIYVTGATDVLVDVLGWYGGTTAERFRALNPVRLRDTRRELGGQGPVPAGGFLAVPLTGGLGLPVGTPIRAVALNLTVTRAARPGYVTAYPCDGPQPPTSNANYVAGRTVANQIVVAVGASSQVCLFASSPTDLVVDLLGWYGPVGGTAGALFTPVTPNRLLDTRSGIGRAGTAPVPPGGTVTLAVGGHGGVAVGAQAVALNVTAADATSDGYVTVFPCGKAMPLASNLNPSPGRATPNHVMVPLGSAGSVCLTSSGATHLLADVAGYFS